MIRHSTKTPEASPARNWRGWLDTLGNLLMIVTAAAVLIALYRGQFKLGTNPQGSNTNREIPVPKAPQSTTSAVLAGDPAARVVVIEYSDFQCPFCAKFAKEIL